MLKCTLEWNSLDLAGWEARFSKIRRAPLLQSYGYARAVSPLYGQKPRWGLIRINDTEAGLVQVMEAKILGGVFHALVIDRGPLWFSGFGGVAHIRAFFDEINTQFPARAGRRRRIIPEIPKSPTVSGLLTQSGLRYRGPDYTTAWVDLTRSADDLRAGLKGNWRSYLNKVERGPLHIVWDEQGQSLNDLIAGYITDRAEKSYPGPSQKLVRALGRTFFTGGQGLIGRAVLDNRTVSSILILRHGSAATYQIGWNDPDGRTHGGHYRLLWAAIEKLKNDGVMDFDLGGLNDDHAENLSAFKDGIGGQRVTLAGLYT